MAPIHLPRLTASLIHDEFGDQPIPLARVHDLGLTRHQVAGALRVGALESPRWGVIQAASPDESVDFRTEHVDRIRSVLCAVPLAVASAESAAVILGLPYPNDNRIWDRSTVRITVPGGIHKGGRGFQAVAAALPASHRTSVDGIPVTTVARSAVELARWYPTRDALITMDAAMRRVILEGWAPENTQFRPVERRTVALALARTEFVRKQFAQTLDCMRRWPGVRAARRAIALANPASESAFESISRGSMVEAELPMPEVGAMVVGDDGRVYYSDFLWRHHKLIGEADGWGKYQMGGQPEFKFREEKLREDALRAAGFSVVRWTWTDVVPSPNRMIEKITAALTRADPN